MVLNLSKLENYSVFLVSTEVGIQSFIIGLKLTTVPLFFRRRFFGLENIE